MLHLLGLVYVQKSYFDLQRLEAEASSRVDGLLKADSSNLVSTVVSLKAYQAWAQDDLENAFKSSADAPSDKALFPVLQKHRDVAVKRFESILDRSLNPNWHDAALDKNWAAPDAAIQASIESAHGMIGERFAYVVDMPMDKFLEVAEKLRGSVYRPTRVRPWTIPEPQALAAIPQNGFAIPQNGLLIKTRLALAAQVSAIWTRDTKRWHIETNVAKSTLPALDKNAENDGLLVDDVCVLPSTEETSDPTCIVLYSEPSTPRMCVRRTASTTNPTTSTTLLVSEWRGLTAEPLMCFTACSFAILLPEPL